MTNAHMPSMSNESEQERSSGEMSTRRWFPNSEEFERFVDGVIQGVDELRTKRAHEQPTLFSIDDEQPGDVDADCACRDLRGLVSQAFLSMFNGKPEDHVVIDPEANREFVSRCRLLGADDSEFRLNQTLLNVRKAGWHYGIERGNSYRLTREIMDRIGFAAEIGARVVQLQAMDRGACEPSIDSILCDPDLRSEFDQAAESVAPGYSSYDYRLAVLSFRKSGRRDTYRLADSDYPNWEMLDYPLPHLDPNDFPAKPAIYSIAAGKSALFVSSTLNLRMRAISHVTVAEGRGLVPESLFDLPRKELSINFFACPSAWKPRTADAVAFRLKGKRKAKFNLFAPAC